MDGYVKIGVSLEDKQFDKELKKLERELDKKRQLEVSLEKLSREMDLVGYKLEEVNKKLEEAREKVANFPEWKQDTPAYDKAIAELNNLELKQVGLTNKADDLNDKYQTQSDKLVQVNGNIDNINNNLDEMKSKAQRVELSGVGENIEGIGNKISDVIRKVSKWVGAIFGIRTAYSLVQKAMSILSQYNDQIRTDVSYISFALAKMLEPIIKSLIQGVFTLLQYINYIAMAWFGINLFANATVKNFKKIGKEAKELHKTLLGFDEMNILNDSGGTGAVGDISPSVDLSQVQADVPEWLKWIGKNKDIILGFFKTLAIIIGTFKLIKFISELGNVGKGISNITNFVKNLIGKLDIVKGLGIAIALVGVAIAIKGIIDFIKDPCWDNFLTILIGVAVAVAGVAIAMGGWTVAIVAAVVAVVALIAKLILQNTTSGKLKKANKELKESEEKLKEAKDNLRDATDNYISAVERNEEAIKKLTELEKKYKISGEELQKQVDNGSLSYENMTAKQREVYKAYLESNKAQDNLKTSTEKLKTATEEKTEAEKKNEEAKRKQIKASWENEARLASEGEKYDEFKKKVVDAFKKGELTASEARDLIERSMESMRSSSYDTFIKDIPDNIKEGLKPDRYKTALTTLKKTFKDAWDSIKSFFGKAEIKITSSAGGGGGAGGFATGGLIVPKLNYLASGGIINMPNKGVPLSRAFGGEAGAEGVIPLTDSQAMETLGSAIGRYITINANIPVSMDGRVISRQIKKVNTNTDFVMNRG